MTYIPTLPAHMNKKAEASKVREIKYWWEADNYNEFTNWVRRKVEKKRRLEIYAALRSRFLNYMRQYDPDLYNEFMELVYLAEEAD